MKTIDDLEGKVYMTCSACMSVYADGLSWANANTDRIVKDAENAEHVVVLSCQVTDLAILNDLRTAERIKAENPDKNYYVSGCLGQRTDVELPNFLQRLETPRAAYQFLDDRTLVHFEKPFWVPNFKEKEEEKEEEQDNQIKDGHLFRNMYPLRIGKSCPNRCSYCTIRITRGTFEQYEAQRLEDEFLAFDDVLLVADSPTVQQVKDWHEIAVRNSKSFSIRNVEPVITTHCKDELLDLADRGLLKAYHSPIQSADPAVLRDMSRNVPATLETMRIAEELKGRGVYIATNIIIDYKSFNQDFSRILRLYDYVSWNPLWDNQWNRQKAEERWQKYIVNGPPQLK
ncbi:hypothetical protein COY27_06665 [Candidatus Woesearchaeota archaeon CG_4_10_14_0_2_um_filter_33_13]|nr:MAG: hypothetical protein COY27_06665 [Candidatus Woesearchaeota archaeon CG_4_10_14_0_2_um_filter_33_13]